MAKEHFKMGGMITEVSLDSVCRVKWENGHQLSAYATGKIRKFRVRLIVSDRVKVGLLPCDLSKTCINYRQKD